jgi:membrane fusion protein, multidrug efflux system
MKRLLFLLCTLYIAAFMLNESGVFAQGGGGSGGGAGRGRGTGGGGGLGRMGDSPIPVTAVACGVADVPVHFESVGTTRALNVVTIRPQVDGKLISMDFQEGQQVKRGDVLAKIDPTIYRARYDRAVAKKALDEAQLANARLDLERFASLLKTKSVTPKKFDTQRSLVASFEAQVELDQAQIDSAWTELNRTNIVSPIDGRTGIRRVDPGNVVRAADPMGVVVITQSTPIAALFSIPEERLWPVNQALEQGQVMIADAIDSENGRVIDRGLLNVVNNQVDQATGAVQAKAEFPNENQQLWPGEFIIVRLLLDTLRQALVVPSAAVQRGSDGPFVYVIQANKTVAVRRVSVTQQNESQAVIASGLQQGEIVAITGFAQLTDGRRVTIAGS